jgi:hypothetical protein
MNSWSTRRVHKNGNSLCNAALHEVRRFERPGAIGIRRYDDDVGGRDRFVDDERPSCGSQNRLPKGANSRQAQLKLLLRGSPRIRLE